MSLQPWGGRAAEDPDRRASNSSLNLVQRAEVLALADLDKPLHVATLAHTLAVSERTLRKAFQNTYGLSPCRHLRMLRLSRVRRALLSAHDQVVTVTKIATEFGFAELGRFSVEYRKVFGESPSVTLRRASRRYEKPNCRGNDLRRMVGFLRAILTRWCRGRQTPCRLRQTKSWPAGVSERKPPDQPYRAHLRQCRREL